MNLKDKFLDWDRRHPGYKIGSVVNADDPLERERHFLHAVSGDFRTLPDPFGSVFRFEFEAPQKFAFAHLLRPASICVSLGNHGFMAFVLDGQALQRDAATIEDFATCPKKGKEDMLFFYAKSVEHLWRHELGQDIVMGEGFLARVGEDGRAFRRAP